MVSLASPGLTKLSFRRNIIWFLAALVGFLVFIILTLLLLLQNAIVKTEEAHWEEWNAIATAANDSLDRLDPAVSRSTLEGHLDYLRRRYKIAAIEMRPKAAPVAISGSTGRFSEAVTRESRFGSVIFSFDASDLRVIRRRFLLTAAICLAATIGGTILLLLFLPSVIKPIEEMLDHAREVSDRSEGVDDARYLIETFRKSIETLKLQEAELKRLHDVEKMRADELERITATLTRSLTSGFIAVNREGRIVDVNAAAREILRLDASEFSGSSILDAMGETEFAQTLSRAIVARATLTRHEIVDGRRGESVAIGLTTVPLLDEDGEFLGMLALFTDLTPIRSLEARLRDLQTLADLGEISAGIAHEFRNSLSTILGYLKLARRQPLPDESNVRIGKAEEEATQLSDAVESLLNFARPMTLEMQRVDLGELAERIIERFGEPDVQIGIHGDKVEIEGDRMLLSRAIENVIRNAVDAIRQKGEPGVIDIELATAPHPTLVVADNGVGIAPDQVS
ncbi:MAG TPA: PAS domain-containing protein, partial [Thermoanaerobaculia bacterium]